MGEIKHSDPTALFPSLFRRPYRSLYNETSNFPWTARQGIIRHCFTSDRQHLDAVYNVLCEYVTKRMNGEWIAGLPTDLVDICGTYWNVMTDEARQKLFDILVATHVFAMAKRGICYRPEFMFLVGYQLSFTWAYPHAETLQKACHGLSELAEVCEKVSQKEFVSALLGKKVSFLHGDVWPTGIPLLIHQDDVDYLNPSENFEGESCRGSLYSWFRMNAVTEEVSARLLAEATILVGLGAKSEC